MGKNIKISAMLIVIMAVSTPAFSQGWNYKSGKDTYTINGKAGATICDGNMHPYVELEVSRQLRNFPLEFSTKAYAFVDSSYGSTTAVPGINLAVGVPLSSEHAYIKPEVMFGMGGARHIIVAENAAFNDVARPIKMVPEYGLGVQGGLTFGNFRVSAELAYRWQGGKTLGESQEDGLTIINEYWVSNNFSFTLGLGYNFGSAVANFDGDHGFQTGVGLGFGKSQNIATIEARWFDRFAYHWMFLWGVEAGQTNGGEFKATSCVLEGGLQYLIFDKKHADSWLMPTVLMKGGIGQASSTLEATATNTIANNSTWSGYAYNVQPGLELGGYVGLSILPLKAFHVKNTRGELEISAGYELRSTMIFDSNWNGVDWQENQKGKNTFGYLKLGVLYTF